MRLIASVAVRLVTSVRLSAPTAPVAAARPPYRHS
jgi:hypothetical protein